MNITIVQGPFLPVPPIRGGAVEKIWYSLAIEFAKRGHHVTHISRSYDGLVRRESKNGVQYIRISGFNSPKSILYRVFLDFIYSCRVYSILPIADILVTNTITLPILLRKKKYGALYIHIQRYPKGHIRLYKHAARLQTVSNVIADAIKDREKSLSDKVKIIPNPLPFEIENLDIESDWINRKKQILYTGRIHPEKGIDILLKAFIKLVKNYQIEWKLVIVGPWETDSGGGGKSYYDYLKQLSNSVKDKVNFIEPIFNQDLLNIYYKESRLFVYPSLADKGEALPLAPMEAMSHGCPPLVSNLKCFGDYIKENSTGFYFNPFKDDASEDLFIKLFILLNAENKLCLVARNCYEQSKQFSLESIAQLYINDFSRLIN